MASQIAKTRLFVQQLGACNCILTWLPGNKTAAPLWPDPILIGWDVLKLCRQFCNTTLSANSMICSNAGIWSSETMINSLWPGDTIDLGQMAQEIACCLMALSHYLNQCWLFFISKVLWHSPGSNLTVCPQATILYNQSGTKQNLVAKI